MKIKSLRRSMSCQGALGTSGQYPSEHHIIPTHDDFSTVIRRIRIHMPRRAKERILMASCIVSRSNRFCVRVSVPDPALVCLQVAFGMCC